MNVRRFFEGICVAFSLIFFSCEKIDMVDNPVKQDGTDVMSLSLKGNDGLEYKSFFINDSTIHVVVPNQYDCSGLTSIVNHNALHASIDDVELNEQVKFDFSDFKSPKELKVSSSLGEGKKYKIVVHDLPVIVIDTPDNRAIDSKTERVEGCIVRLVEAPGKIDSLGVAGIRGRGQSSWEQPKKPYNIKFESKTPILGMPKSKHWILLANAFYDRTQLHNATAFEMARMTDYPWVPDGRFVELILNGEHKGLYYICEKIREEKGKIELGEGDCLLESYIVLKDGYKESSMPDNYIKTQYFNETGQPPYECVLGWESKYPEDTDSETKTRILSKLEEVEHLIFDEQLLLTGEYRSKFDIETAINWFLVQEATLNEEASRTKNVYLYTVGGHFMWARLGILMHGLLVYMAPSIYHAISLRFIIHNY